MSSVALVVATHNGTSRMKEFGGWIGNQKGAIGALIVVASGNTDVSELQRNCQENGINFAFENFRICGLAKRNRGAEMAAALGCEYVTFLNDYQHLAPGALRNFESERHEETVVFGCVEFEVGAPITKPRISRAKLPVSTNSSAKDTWALFSSVSEAGLLMRTDFFRRIRGWQYPSRDDSICLGGDGMFLVARTFSLGGKFGYSPSYQVLGGHRNAEISNELAKSKGAMYPYAFTLSTKVKGVPKWIAPRFILGRLFRLLQKVLKGEIREAPSTIFEINSRLRAYMNLPPSRHASMLSSTLADNCKSSNYICHIQGATPCMDSLTNER